MHQMYGLHCSHKYRNMFLHKGTLEQIMSGMQNILSREWDHEMSQPPKQISVNNTSILQYLFFRLLLVMEDWWRETLSLDGPFCKICDLNNGETLNCLGLERILSPRFQFNVTS